MKKFLLALCCLLICSQAKPESADYYVIPAPSEVLIANSMPFVLSSATKITYPKGNKQIQSNAELLVDYIAQLTGIRPGVAVAKKSQPKGSIALVVDKTLGGGYQITVETDRVVIRGTSEECVFRGVQTLRKSLPIGTAESVELPAARITDKPRFQYRGMHLDVSRHFFDKDFIKKYIEILALHGVNTFHWHLTDNQGWRIDINKYPRLTEGVPHYTQAEAREVVEYAARHYITVTPEIDLPGHMAAALKAYPNLACRDQHKSDPVWGNLGSVLCLGNEETYRFLEDVMTELVKIFPSEVIHMGGDEASRERWKACPLCQQKIRDEHLDVQSNDRYKPEDRLQSYCMDRVGKILSKLGRRYMAWDEALDGNPLPDATIMIWRDPKSAELAHKRGNKVVMTPGSHCYFDFYQTSNTETEPEAFGGYMPVQKVYSFEPTDGLSPEAAQVVLGCQANLWTECVPNSNHVEYMTLPRLAAMSEVQWCEKGKKDYAFFVSRLYHMMDLYDHLGYNYSRHIFDVECSLTRLPEKRALQVTLSNIDNSPIYYTLDGTAPTVQSARYTGPFEITASAHLCASTIREGETKPAVAPTQRTIDFGKSTYRDITLDETYLEAPRYAYDGKITLVDGIRGKMNFGSGDWMGFVGGSTAATIDFGEPTEISSASTACLVDMPSWIMGCSRLVLEISADGKSFTQVAERDFPDVENPSLKEIQHYTVEFAPVKARYARLTIVPSPDFPATHDGHGHKPYMFVDEVVIK